MQILNKKLIPIHILNICISIIILSAKADNENNFYLKEFTLKSRPKLENGITFYVYEDLKKFDIMKGYCLPVTNKKAVLNLKINSKIALYLKKEEKRNIVEKINESLGRKYVYGLKYKATTLLKLQDYISYREKDLNSFIGKLVYFFIAVTFFYSFCWLFFISICIINPSKIHSLKKSKLSPKSLFKK